METSQGNNSNKGMWIFASIATIAAIALWLLVPTFLTSNYFHYEEDPNIIRKGAYGDTYGTVNALFTALAFVGILVTLFLQRKQLHIQTHELILQRREFQGQKEQLEIQSKNFKHQRFDNTFFELLRVHNDTVFSLYTVESGREMYGRSCLNIQVIRLRQIYEKGTHVNECMTDLYKLTPRLHNYLSQLYYFVKFIDDSDIEQKKHYTGIVQAQLNNDELILLTYSGLSRQGESFKPLIEEHGLLEHLNWGTLFDKSHAGMYSDEAFAERGYRHEVRSG